MEFTSYPLTGLRRLVPPIEGMLAEHPLGGAVASHTPESSQSGERPQEYLFSRYADRFAGAEAGEEPGPRADTFELYATILRHQIESMLARSTATEPDAEAVALASLWSRVAHRPRGRGT